MYRKLFMFGNWQLFRLNDHNLLMQCGFCVSSFGLLRSIFFSDFFKTCHLLNRHCELIAAKQVLCLAHMIRRYVEF